MAIDAPHLAAIDLRGEPGDANLLASKLHHPAGLFADVIELEHARVPLAAVDAPGPRERGDREADVAFVCLRPPRARGRLGLEPARPRSKRRSPAMAICTHDLAAAELLQEHGEPDPAPDKRRDLRTLGSNVVELEHDRFLLATVRASALPQIVEYKSAGRLDAFGL